MIEKETITTWLPDRILNDELQKEIVAQFGDGIGWAVEWDKETNLPKAIHVEYDSELGIDPKKLKEAFQAHRVPAEVDDDFQQAQKLQVSEAQKATDLAHVLDNFKALESRVATLEALLGVKDG